MEVVCGLLALCKSGIEDSEEMAIRARPEQPQSASFLCGKAAEGSYMVLHFLRGAGGGFYCVSLAEEEGEIPAFSLYVLTSSREESCREGEQRQPLVAWHPLQSPEGGPAPRLHPALTGLGLRLSAGQVWRLHRWLPASWPTPTWGALPARPEQAVPQSPPCAAGLCAAPSTGLNKCYSNIIN